MARRQKDRRDLLADPAVRVEVAGAEDGVRREAPRLRERLADPHARFVRLGAGRRDEARAGLVSSDHERAIAQRGVQAPFDDRPAKW